MCFGRITEFVKIGQRQDIRCTIIVVPIQEDRTIREKMWEVRAKLIEYVVYYKRA